MTAAVDPRPTSPPRRPVSILLFLVIAASGCVEAVRHDDSGGSPPTAVSSPCPEPFAASGGKAILGWWARREPAAWLTITIQRPPGEGESISVQGSYRIADGTPHERAGSMQPLFQHDFLTIDGTTHLFTAPDGRATDYEATPSPVSFPHRLHVPINGTHEVGLFVLDTDEEPVASVQPVGAVISHCVVYDHAIAERSGTLSRAAPASGPPAEAAAQAEPGAHLFAGRMCAVRTGGQVTPLGETLSVRFQPASGNGGERTYGANGGQPVPYGLCIAASGALQDRVRFVASFEGELADATVYWRWTYAETARPFDAP